MSVSRIAYRVSREEKELEKKRRYEDKKFELKYFLNYN